MFPICCDFPCLWVFQEFNFILFVAFLKQHSTVVAERYEICILLRVNIASAVCRRKNGCSWLSCLILQNLRWLFFAFQLLFWDYNSFTECPERDNLIEIYFFFLAIEHALRWNLNVLKVPSDDWSIG